MNIKYKGFEIAVSEIGCIFIISEIGEKRRASSIKAAKNRITRINNGSQKM